ncbi:MAG: DUF1003 domain-containing protein [Actinobacteria bacterium]|nr:DUF1003 domain-containing protein [Actinomycetota bacterium]MCA1719670.1 DUF1003 domain-containing protein [Actinomycetota bacterium]
MSASVDPRPPVTGPAPDLARVVDRNIGALSSRAEQEDRARSAQERLADRVTGFTGSLSFVLLHVVLFGLWVLVNVGALYVEPFDPSFVILATTASVEAIFLSTFVLISQNRMQVQADARAELDLHVSLLSEHEITRLITLVQAIARRLDVDEANDPELAELARDVAPERVLEEIESNRGGA